MDYRDRRFGKGRREVVSNFKSVRIVYRKNERSLGEDVGGIVFVGI